MYLTLSHQFLSLSSLLLSILLFTNGSSALPWESPAVPEGLAFPPPPAAAQNSTLKYIDPSLPPLLLPSHSPKCSLLVLQHDFADTVGSPPEMANYTTPPDCPAPWSRVVLELSFSASDLQKDLHSIKTQSLKSSPNVI